jgi:hypothetical protein
VTTSQSNTVFVDGTTRTIVGAAWTINVAGQGALVLDAGRLVLGPGGEVVFEAGPHEMFHHDLAALCAYFSSP